MKTVNKKNAKTLCEGSKNHFFGKILAKIFFIFSISTLNGQIEIRFLAHDAFKESELTHTYISGFPFEVSGNNIISVSCDNGIIIRDTLGFDFFCLPKKTGHCIVSVKTKENGKIKKLSKSILVIKKPKVSLDVKKNSLIDSLIIHYTIIDLDSKKQVTSDYYCGEFNVELLLNNNEKVVLVTSELNGIIDLNEFDSIDKYFSEVKKITILLQLFNKKTGLPIDKIRKEILTSF